MTLNQMSEDAMVQNVQLFRSELVSQLMNPGKDINYSCGYPDTITKTAYKKIYDREGIATRVVNVLPTESWVQNPVIIEDVETKETEFEKIWKDLNREKHILSYMLRIDVLSGIGEYGLLLLGISDGLSLVKPVAGIDEKTGDSSGNNDYELLYLKPFDESTVEIKTKEADITSKRFGLPTMYTIQMEAMESGGSTITTIDVHWTRTIHIADNRQTSEIRGMPRMQNVYNRLLDIRKIVSGSGEMFWKGAFPGYAFEVDADNTGTIDTDSVKEGFNDYSSGMQRYLLLQGMKAKSLDAQAVNPKDHLDAQIRYIALTLGIPYRVFMGTEQGVLAGEQDAEAWNNRRNKRREDYITPFIIRPVIDYFIGLGILPEPVDSYEVEWPDIQAPSEEEVATVADKKTTALAKYVGVSVDALIDPKNFLMKIMQMSEEEADAIGTKALERIADRVEDGPANTKTEGDDDE